jgi:hypothetical protein
VPSTKKRGLCLYCRFLCSLFFCYLGLYTEDLPLLYRPIHLVRRQPPSHLAPRAQAHSRLAVPRPHIHLLLGRAIVEEDDVAHLEELRVDGVALLVEEALRHHNRLVAPLHTAQEVRRRAKVHELVRHGRTAIAGNASGCYALLWRDANLQEAEALKRGSRIELSNEGLILLQGHRVAPEDLGGLTALLELFGLHGNGCNDGFGRHFN